MKDTTTMNQTKHDIPSQIDNSRKSILARGCDPLASLEAARVIPPHVGNPEYFPTTTDEEFAEKLRSRRWSVVFFAPGACRFMAARRQIPGGNSETHGWTLEEYRKLVQQHQGADIEIVETLDERETVGLLREALHRAQETN
jgi:hypothetical protein